MIELVSVHEPKNSVERVPRKSRASEHAQFYTEKYTTEDGQEHPYSADINMKYGKQWNKITDSVNVTFGNPDNELKERKITMVDTDYERQKRHIGTDGKSYEFYPNYKGTYSYRAKAQTPPPKPPEKPHWFERFLRWWYTL